MNNGEFKTRLNVLVRTIKEGQRESHELVKSATYHAWKHGDTIQFKWMFEGLHSVNGSFNLKGLKEYVEEYCGVKVTQDKDSEKYSVKKDDKWAGSRDALGMAKIRDNPWYEVKKKDRPLDLPNPGSVYTSIAKLLEVGEWTEHDLDMFIQGIKSKAKEKRKDKTVVAWVQAFKDQKAA